MSRRDLPTRRSAETVEITHIHTDGSSQNLILTIGRYPDFEEDRVTPHPLAGKLAEVFIDIPWSRGWYGQALTGKDTATLISIALQSGTEVTKLAEAMGRAEINYMGTTRVAYHTIAGTVLSYLASLK